jgi:chromosome partitioning protein
MRKISILNFKGGVGKSTSAINIGDALAREGKNVLLVDCDLQANASTLLPAPHTPTLTDVLREQARALDAIANARNNLDVLSADANLDKAARYIASEGHHAYYILQRAMQQLDTLGAYDFVFFDHSPSYSAVTQAALLASDEMLIPCELGTFSIERLLQMFEKLEQTLTHHTLSMTGIIPFKLNTSIAMHKGYLQDLHETFTGQVLSPVRQDAEIGKAQSYHQSIFEYNPHSKAAEDFRRLARTLIEGKVTA